MPKKETENNLLYFNGINGATGEYHLPPMTGKDLSQFIKGEAKPENLDELKFRSQKGDHYGLAAGVDPKDLAEAGWGVIFAHDEDPAVKEALSELLELRRGQAGERFKIYEKGQGYRPKDTKPRFTARHGASPGPVDPERMPYYLLIVGSPEKIPFTFQYQLDVQYAVGRIHFDTAQEYANYAAGVKAAETGAVNLARQAAFFGVANNDDRATALSAKHLVNPLFEQLKKDQANWGMDVYLKEAATKDQLARLLGGGQTPALLFSASHGMAFPKDDSRQVPHQGAILCQDWPGKSTWHEAIPQDFYFAGDDIASDANLLGLIAFFFACYGAGTPLNDDFSKQAFKTRQAIAENPFVAGLPVNLLNRPKGSALAAIGHVERAWGYSFLWPGVAPQTTVFESALKRILEGYPVGAAFEFFDERYAELASDLSLELEEIEFGKKVDAYELAGMWTANNDARSYVVIGDPAVRLPVAETEKKAMKRPAIAVRSFETLSVQADESEMSSEVAPADTVDLDFGLRDMGQNIGGSLKNVSCRLADMLTKAVDDLTSLEVSTYTGSDMDEAAYDPDNKRFSQGAKLRAHTRIALDGDMHNLIPERASADDDARTGTEIDEQLWTIHRQMVELAQSNRVSFVKALAEVAGTLLKTIK